MRYREGGRYGELETVEEALWWMRHGEYTIANFSGGPGLSPKDGGGLRYYLADGLAERLTRDGYIGVSCQLTRKGFLFMLARQLSRNVNKDDVSSGR
jgi:hypothetical protein